jgi:hypothetical protein
MLVLPASAQTAASQLRTDVVFTEYSALSSTAELVRRLYSPLSAIRINQEAQRAGRTLRGQPIDLAKEHYSIYVPDHPHSPSGAYSLLGYPDVFHGALLNAGSDPIGTLDVPLPPADLFRRFQESTRLVYLTGERDEENLGRDVHSRRSLDKWCAYEVLTQTEPRTGHELADASAFGRSLEALLGERHADPAKLEACRARIDQELRTQVRQVENAFARGDSNSAKQLLSQIDARYGGLAAGAGLTPRN